MPCELLDGCFVVLIYVLLVVLLVVGKHDALHQLIVILHLAEFLLYVCPYVCQEAVFGVLVHLLLEVGSNLLTEFLLAVYCSLAEGLVEEFLVDGVLVVA